MQGQARDSRDPQGLRCTLSTGTKEHLLPGKWNRDHIQLRGVAFGAGWGGNLRRGKWDQHWLGTGESTET